VDYLIAARKTGPGGAGADLGGQPPCVTGGSGRRGRRASVPTRRTHRRPGCLARLPCYCCGRGSLAGTGGLASVGGRGRGGQRARRRTGAGEGGGDAQAAWLRCSRNGLPARASGPQRGLYPLCRATDQAAALPRQDRWRAEPCHIIGHRFWSPPRQPSAAPPCMARHRHLATPGQ